MATVENPDSQRLKRLSILATRAFVESGLHGIESEVVLAMDVSRPMMPMYASGSIQDLVEGLFTLGLCFDDDGVVPTWSFGETARSLEPLTREEVGGWVAREVIRGTDFQERCHYAPVIDAICRKYFPRESSQPIVERKVGGALKRTVREYPQLVDRRPFAIFVIVITGDDCADPTETIRCIERASHLPIFFQFAGISPAGIPRPPFRFLRELDRLSGRWVDNCGFFEPLDFQEPRELFPGLLNEYPSYLQEERVKAMLLPPPEPAEIGGPVAKLSEEDAARLAVERAERERRRQARLREPIMPNIGEQREAAQPEAPRRVAPKTRPYVQPTSTGHVPRAAAPPELTRPPPLPTPSPAAAALPGGPVSVPEVRPPPPAEPPLRAEAIPRAQRPTPRSRTLPGQPAIADGPRPTPRVRVPTPSRVPLPRRPLIGDEEEAAAPEPRAAPTPRRAAAAPEVSSPRSPSTADPPTPRARRPAASSDPQAPTPSPAGGATHNRPRVRRTPTSPSDPPPGAAAAPRPAHPPRGPWPPPATAEPPAAAHPSGVAVNAPRVRRTPTDAGARASGATPPPPIDPAPARVTAAPAPRAAPQPAPPPSRPAAGLATSSHVGATPDGGDLTYEEAAERLARIRARRAERRGRRED